jgi:hypothetical protein
VLGANGKLQLCVGIQSTVTHSLWLAVKPVHLISTPISAVAGPLPVGGCAWLRSPGTL